MNYVISDIHGCYDELIELVKLIDLRDEDTLYIIGDTVDRGPKPIEDLSWMMMQPNVIPIMGNHEYMMMRVLLLGLKEVDSNEAIDKTITLDYLTDVNLWFLSDNGGKITSDSFRKLPKCDREDLLDYVKDFSFYEEVTVSGQRFVMVHTINEDIHCFDDLENADLSEPEEFLISRPNFDDGLAGEDFFIIGHTPTCFLGKKDNRIYRKGKLIDIDCGCVMGGNLAALCLETMEEFYVKGRRT